MLVSEAGVEVEGSCWLQHGMIAAEAELESDCCERLWFVLQLRRKQGEHSRSTVLGNCVGVVCRPI